MLVEMAVADAYAIAWEFVDSQKAPNDLSAFHQHPTYAELTPGQYTDDTQRSIANAMVLLSSDRTDKFNPLRYAEAYLKVVAVDPREGYSRGYQAFLSSTANGYDFLTNIKRDKVSNGSLMGVAPLGFLADLQEVKLAAMTQAITTHHPETAPHAQLVAMASHYFLHVEDSPREALYDWLMLNSPFARTGDGDAWFDLASSYADASRKKTSIRADSISAYMVYAVSTFDSLTEIIKDAVDRGGDTDSAAAVSVAVASCCPEITNDIPEHLIDVLAKTNPGFGPSFLTKLESKLRSENEVA